MEELTWLLATTPHSQQHPVPPLHGTRGSAHPSTPVPQGTNFVREVEIRGDLGKGPGLNLWHTCPKGWPPLH